MIKPILIFFSIISILFVCLHGDCSAGWKARLFDIPPEEPVTGAPLESSKLLAQGLPVSGCPKFLFSPNGRRVLFVSDYFMEHSYSVGATGGKEWQVLKSPFDIEWKADSSDYTALDKFTDDARSKFRLNTPVIGVLAKFGKLEAKEGGDPYTLVIMGDPEQPYIGRVQLTGHGEIDFHSVRFSRDGSKIMFGSFKPNGRGDPRGSLWWNVIDVSRSDLARDKQRAERRSFVSSDVHVFGICDQMPLVPPYHERGPSIVVNILIENNIKITEAQILSPKESVAIPAYVDTQTSNPGNEISYRFSFDPEYCALGSVLKVRFKSLNMVTGKQFIFTKEVPLERPD